VPAIFQPKKKIFAQKQNTWNNNNNNINHLSGDPIVKT